MSSNQTYNFCLLIPSPHRPSSFSSHPTIPSDPNPYFPPSVPTGHESDPECHFRIGSMSDLSQSPQVWSQASPVWLVFLSLLSFWDGWTLFLCKDLGHVLFVCLFYLAKVPFILCNSCLRVKEEKKKNNPASSLWKRRRLIHLRLMPWVCRESLYWAPGRSTPMLRMLISIGFTVIMQRAWGRKVAQPSHDSHLSSFSSRSCFIFKMH